MGSSLNLTVKSFKLTFLPTKTFSDINLLNLFVSIPIVDDTLPEATENFLFVVGSVLSGNTLNDSAGGVITITDNDTAQYPITGEIVACTDPATGTALFDITSMSSYFSNGNNGFTFISYHATQQDAAAGTNALISPLELATTTAIFVRITDDTITLQQISTLFCNVDQTPIIPAGVSLTECDGNGDGYADFDLGQFVLSQVISNTQALEISFYETEADLNNPNALMLNSSSHTNLVVSGETIYYRIVDLITGCTSIGSFNITVDSSC